MDGRLARTRTFLAAAAFSAALLGCGLSSAGIASAPKEEALAPIALERPPDRQLKDRLTGILQEMELGSVHVEVREGVVHLRGTTDSLGMHRATSMAKRLEGVVEVSSDVDEPSSIWGPLAPTGRALRRLGRGGLELVPQLVAALVVFAPFVFLSIFLRRWRRPFHAFGLSSLSSNLLRLAFRGLAILTGAVLALDVLGIMGTVGAVVGTLGVMGLAAGLVFKDWVSNYLPGVMLGLRPPFKAGDLIQIGEREGRVARITPSATVLVTTDGETVRIPNTEFFRDTMVNFSHRRTRRLRFVMSLATHADLAAAEERGCRAMLGLRAVMKKPPPFMRMRALERDQVDVEFFAWVDQDAANFRNVESRARRAVLESLAKGGVPLPAMMVTLRQQEPKAGAGPLAVATDDRRVDVAVDAAEALDEAFLGERFEEVRTAPSNEQDLLEGGKHLRH
jgi:small-conductance mechanosensitive channel